MRFLFRGDLAETAHGKWMKAGEASDAEVLIFLEGTESVKQTGDILDRSDIFCMDADRILGIGFAETLSSKVGSLNPKFSQDSAKLYEFACRLVSASNKTCVWADSMDEGTEALKEVSARHLADPAFLYAYIFRLHMQRLHTSGLMDAVFEKICALMQKKGCFAAFQQNINRLLTDPETFERIAGYTAPFLVLRGDETCGGILQQFADDLVKALADNGQAVIELGQNEADYDKVQGMLAKGIIGFQTKALEIDFFRKIRGPKFQFWFDNPLRTVNILREQPEDYYVLCQDADHAELIRKHYHTANAVQFPPGGVEQPFWDGDRPYDVMFMGTFFPDEYEALSERQKEFYDHMKRNPDLTFEKGFLELMGDEAEESSLPEAMLELKPACRAVIARFKNAVIKTILDAGITLHVYGDSWRRASFCEHENLVIHPQVSMEESIQEYQKAKIGLNIMSWYKAGMTERVANIMLAGAVCLSDETTYLREHTENGKEIVLYHLGELERIPEMIFHLLQNPGERKQIARQGYEKAIREFSWNVRAKQLVDLSETWLEQQASLRIYVATHVKFEPPQNPIYVPLHVGRYGKADLGYQGDDTGENISDLNYLYGELTGLYWIWQNVTDVDYVGLCHYRRYFINGDKQVMDKAEYLAVLREYDAIVPKAIDCAEGRTYYEQFSRAHNCHDLDAVEYALKKLYPEYAPAYDKAMQGHIAYGGNLVVTRLGILQSYAEWLFTIFVEAGEMIDVSGYDAYHKRVYGFLSEQMFYVYALANHLKLFEITVGMSMEKAETRELKETLRIMIKEGRSKAAGEMLNMRLQERPDLMLPDSDFDHGLRDIYDQLKSGSYV